MSSALGGHCPLACPVSRPLRDATHLLNEPWAKKARSAGHQQHRLPPALSGWAKSDPSWPPLDCGHAAAATSARVGTDRGGMRTSPSGVRGSQHGRKSIGAVVKPTIPGGLIFLAPGGLFGAQRLAIVEIKAGPGALVVYPEPDSVLMAAAGPETVPGYHLSIHPTLMVHLRRGKAKRRLLEPVLVDGKLAAETVHLGGVTAAPAGAGEPYQGRYQSTFHGAVFRPAMPDAKYDPIRTHLLVDVWACRAGSQHLMDLGSSWPGGRPAAPRETSHVWGPLNPRELFKDAAMRTTFRIAICTWFVESSEPRPFIVPPGGVARLA
jgi:hypothetical protein